MRKTLFGAPIPVAPKSSVTVLLLEPSKGFSHFQPPSDLDPGQSPYSMNFVMREGGLELRPTLSSFTSNANPVAGVTGGMNLVSSVGSNYPLVSGMSKVAYYSTDSLQWSLLSYVSAGGMNAPLSTTSVQYSDMVQSYDPANDEMVALIASGSYQTLYTWKANTGIYSSITSAPRAKYLATADNFVLAANVRDVGSVQSYYVQRVQWSDRGGPLTWNPATTNIAGFEDLLDAKGGITRLATIDNLLLIFFNDEVWQGVRQQSGNAAWAFSPLDRSVGCPYPWTVVNTPQGVLFMSRSYMVYLLPKGGGPAAPVGQAVRRWLSDRIAKPELAWAVFDPQTNTYRLHYAIGGGTGKPTEAVWLNLGENSWAPQSYVNAGGTFSLTRGFLTARDGANPTITWNSLLSSGEVWTSISSSWLDLFGQQVAAFPVMAAGSSDGTTYYEGTSGLDDTVPVLATWRSQALDADSPGIMGVLQEVRMDYAASAPSVVSFQASRDQGASWDATSAVTAQATPVQGVQYFYPYTAAPYPTFQIQSSSPASRIYRFWAKLRQGGRV